MQRIIIFSLLLLMNQLAYASIWDNVDRVLPATTQGHSVAISCHNCYTADGLGRIPTLADTLGFIHQAQAGVADLIELDLVFHNNRWIVSHGELAGPYLTDVLNDSTLQQGNQVLFIEIKSNLLSTNATQSTDNLLAQLQARQYARSGRPLVIRSFHEETLKTVSLSLNKSSYANLAAHTKLSRLYSANNFSSLLQWQSDIARMANSYHMVEFNYLTKDLFSLIDYAKHLQLAVNLWTIRSFAEVFSSAYRNEIDAITVDAGNGLSREDNLEVVRSNIIKNNNLLYVNMAEQHTDESFYLRYVDQTTSRLKYRHSLDMPSWEWLDAIGEDRFGGSMVFNNRQYAKFFDRDNVSYGGFFVSAVVNFDSFDTSTTQAIVNKSDSGGFALELGSSNLRFGVHVNGQYYYANYPTANLNLTRAYHIIGAYDGFGSIRLWIDGQQVSYSNWLSGGVTQNNSPIIIGADPQGSNDQRFFFSGKIQRVNVLQWHD